MRLPLAVMGGLLLASLLLADPSPEWKPERAFPNLDFALPVFITYPPDGSDRLFVVEQDGRVRWFENRADEIHIDLALDISTKVRRQHMEEGLLGMAFHPKFKSNRKVYLMYSTNSPRRTVISEFAMNATRIKILPRTERVLLEIEKSYGNHNGGMLAFGPEGYLYVSIGDGGGAGDPNGNAQNKTNLLGKILRIDVDHREFGKPYAIPLDNPFVKEPESRGEIYALGLRNVWRFSFDRKTGSLWAGDVGQDAWEEIDIIRKGLNYGWNVREGSHPYERTTMKNAEGPFKEPLFDYDRNAGQSITGGYVYRGAKWPDLQGAYIYADFVSGTIWALRAEGEKIISNTAIAKGATISSFGEDKNGELYYLSLYEGKIYTLKKK